MRHLPKLAILRLLAVAAVVVAAVALTPGHRAVADDGDGCRRCRPPAAIVAAFAAFDAATSPPAAGQPADVVLAPWLGYLAPDVEFLAGNAPALVGRAQVASYFAPLLPFIGSTTHALDTISPICGLDDVWIVRGTLHLTRASDGRAITPIPFTDTLFLDRHGKIARYEIRFDPTPIGELFAP